jgi:putative restriction endonuclease
LWLFGQFAATDSSTASYQQAEEPVSQLINDFGPPVASSAAARQRAAMPFVHLERDLWDLRDAAGQEIGPDATERRAWLLDRGALGRLRAPVEHLLADPKTLAAAARLLLDLHFTPVLAELICAAVDLDVSALDLAGTGGATPAARLRRPYAAADAVAGRKLRGPRGVAAQRHGDRCRRGLREAGQDAH